jgi:hypothetical protein
MNDNVEDLTELRLWSLEKIKENKAKVARTYGIWFGKQYYHWELRTQRMASGPQTGMGRIGLTKFYLGMHICLKYWMVSSSRWQSTVNISRDTSQACGPMSSKADVMHQAISRCDRWA